jgi:hypothetical protein
MNLIVITEITTTITTTAMTAIATRTLISPAIIVIVIRILRSYALYIRNQTTAPIDTH